VIPPTHPFSTVHYEDNDTATLEEAEEVYVSKSADEQWQVFQQSNVNAWDSVPGIEHYVRAMVDSQGKRGKPPSLQQSTGTQDLGSPLLERRNRRESLILTDFPSAIERPSLPVTPAAVRRPMFWGEEKHEINELASATGVPDQTEWVCPQCGFSSCNTSCFHRGRKSFASVSSAAAIPLASAVVGDDT